MYERNNPEIIAAKVVFLILKFNFVESQMFTDLIHNADTVQQIGKRVQLFVLNLDHPDEIIDGSKFLIWIGI
jgi:hypothetical protein